MSETQVEPVADHDDILPYTYYLADDGTLMFSGENRKGIPVTKSELSAKDQEKVKMIIPVRDELRALIQSETSGSSDKEIMMHRAALNTLYDAFSTQFGSLSDENNRKVFKEDAVAALLLSIEKTDSKGNFKEKGDIFFKRTIKAEHKITHCDRSFDALAVSIAELGRVDLDCINKLTGLSEDNIVHELKGQIYKDPETDRWVTADEYLSGNVRKKLSTAMEAADRDHDKGIAVSPFDDNISALKEVQPVPVSAADISITMGTSWVPTEYYEQFMYELFETPDYLRRGEYYYRSPVVVEYSPVTNTYSVTGKKNDRGNVNSEDIYGTSRFNGYELFEKCLNLKNVKVMDTAIDAFGDRHQVKNEKETGLAIQKMELIKEKFSTWIFDDPDRREVLCHIYNEKFNSIRNREFNGDYLTFPGMNTEVSLQKHQRDVVSRVLIGSTQKMGAGVNVQERLAALHHLDVPWRPSDIEQREGRILRQGNLNKKVKIFKYVTKKTFDAYSWQLIESKLRFISQVMSNQASTRDYDDGDAVLDAATIKALATGDPLIIEKAQLDQEVSKLKMERSSYLQTKYKFQDDVTKILPPKIQAEEDRLNNIMDDISTFEEADLYGPTSTKFTGGDTDDITLYDENIIIINGKTYSAKDPGNGEWAASKAWRDVINKLSSTEIEAPYRKIGEYRGCDIEIRRNMRLKQNQVLFGRKNKAVFSSVYFLKGLLKACDKFIDSLPELMGSCQRSLKSLQNRLATEKEQIEKPFEKEEQLASKSARLAELDAHFLTGKYAGLSQPSDIEELSEQKSFSEPSEDTRAINDTHYDDSEDNFSSALSNMRVRRAI